MSHKKIVIAIDGYSSCGKSTFAKAIAASLGYVFIDTGAMYRAVTLYSIQNSILDEPSRLVEQLDNIHITFRFNDSLGRSEIYLNGKNVDSKIRSQTVNDNVSKVSQIAQVRAKLVAMQQAMGEQKGVVMDGRDIGTVVFPGAELKIFMTADPVIRAKRRFAEMGGAVSLSEIEANVRERDFLDENREISPLRRAADAFTLDNSQMSVQQQMEWVSGLISERIR